MNPEDALHSLMAGSIVMMFLGLLLSVTFFGIWLFALLHCLKHRQDKDRVTWVLVTLFGGPIGGLIYLAMGRQKAQQMPPPILYSPTPPPIPIAPQPYFDHGAMADEKKRALAMQEAIWSEAKANRARGR